MKGTGTYCDHMFEIQLHSVIMDFWISIAHNLEYKSMTGDQSNEEHRILDGFKGFAKTREFLLEHLQEVLPALLTSDSKAIEDFPHS
jgi:ppGpp synthetase/RelA/SpoT-type nucleotidyltranferase